MTRAPTPASPVVPGASGGSDRLARTDSAAWPAPAHHSKLPARADGTALPAASVLAALPAHPGLAPGPDGPVFGAPWQAQAFALVLALHERGAFGWPDWAQALSRAIAAAQQRGDPDDGSTYWQHWLDALDALVVERGLGDAAQLQALVHAWEAAAERTPHGQPIELTPADRGPSG